MPNNDRIHKIFSDVRNKVAKNANFPASLKQKFDFTISSEKSNIQISKK